MTPTGTRSLLLTLLGAGAATGLIVGLARQWPSRVTGEDEATRRRHAWRTYLIEHLAGSDAALIVVSRIAESHAGTREGDLCAWLRTTLERERDVVRSLIEQTGRAAGALSIKRLAGLAAGRAAQAMAGGRPGELSLFRTIESLSIAVQGKRLLWRTAQQCVPEGDENRQRFEELERGAVRQWERVEACRLSLATATFDTTP